MEADVASRYRSRILREMNANRENPFNSPPSSTGSHGTVTMSSVFSDPEGESTRRLNEDIARVTAPRKLPVNWDAAHKKWPEYFSKPKTRNAPVFDENSDARPHSAQSKENKPPVPSFKFPEEDSTCNVWDGSKRKRAEMQARADNESDLSILLAKSPAGALSTYGLNNRHLSPASKPHGRTPSEPAPAHRRPSISAALDRLRRASTSPKHEQRHMSGANVSPNMSSAKSSMTAVPPSPVSMASPYNETNVRSFFMPDVSHLGDFVTGTLRFSGSVKNGVPILVKQGKVHDKKENPSAASHVAVDGLKIPNDEEKIFVSMDMIRDEIVSLQESHDKVQEYAMNLQQQLERQQGQSKPQNTGKETHFGFDIETKGPKAQLDKEIANLQARLDKATQKLSTSEITNDTLSHERDRVLTRLQEACDDINKLTRKLTVKEKALENSQKQLDSSDQVRQDNDTLRRDLVAMTHGRDALELENSSLRSDNEGLEKEIQGLRDEVESLRSNNNRLRREQESLLTENRSLRSSGRASTKFDSKDDPQELAAARQELEDLRQEAAEARQELATYREDNESLVRHNEKYFTDNKVLRRENSGFERSIHELREENRKLKEDVDFLKEQIDHYRPAPKANIERTENMSTGLLGPEITLNHTNRTAPAEPTQTVDLPNPTDFTTQSEYFGTEYTESVTRATAKEERQTRNKEKTMSNADGQGQKVAFSVPGKPGPLKSNMANQGSKRRSASRAGQRQAAKPHFEAFSDYDETTGPFSVENGVTQEQDQDQAVELSVPIPGTYRPTETHQATPYPRKAKQFQHTVEADITAPMAKNAVQDTCPAITDDTKRVMQGLCKHNCSNCIVCARITSHRGTTSAADIASGKKRVTVSRPVPVTDRDLSVEDPTMRPSQSPGHALALVIKGLEDESRHLELELSQQQAKYSSSDKALGRRDRVALAERIRTILKRLEVKNDQIYSLYDVLEGQKAAGQAMTEEELEMTVLNITGMTVRDVTGPTEITWEGITE